MHKLSQPLRPLLVRSETAIEFEIDSQVNNLVTITLKNICAST